MKNYMKRKSRFMEQYYAIYADSDLMCSSKIYYAALSDFAKRNNGYFTKEILKTYNLDILVSLDPDVYVTKQTKVSLEVEKKLNYEREYTKLVSLAMSISTALWNLVPVYSNNTCPITDQYAMRYVILKDETDKEYFLEECEQCGYLQDVFGKKFSDTGGKFRIYPAVKGQVDDYLQRVFRHESEQL